MVLALAKVANLSLGEVATHLDLHRNSLAEKVAGRRPFTEDEIVALAELFGVTPGRMFDDPAELLGISGPNVTALAAKRPRKRPGTGTTSPSIR